MDRRHPLPVAYLAGIPRFLWGRAARSLVRFASPQARTAREIFGDELRMWDVAGYFYGRHIYTLARFSPIKSRRRADSTALAGPVPKVPEPDHVELAG
jgi:hypothetical protein